MVDAALVGVWVWCSVTWMVIAFKQSDDKPGSAMIYGFGSAVFAILAAVRLYHLIGVSP